MTPNYGSFAQSMSAPSKEKVQMTILVPEDLKEEIGRAAKLIRMKKNEFMVVSIIRVLEVLEAKGEI